MFLTFFELTTRRINAIKDEPNFIKKHGKDFMRAFQEEMEYAVYRTICASSLDINTELDRIEEKYKFNDDMDILLCAVASPVKDAALSKYSRFLHKCKESKDAEDYVKGYCLQMMDMMCSCEIYPEPSPQMIEDEKFNWKNY